MAKIGPGPESTSRSPHPGPVVGQLPGPGQVFLDHLGHFTPDMDQASADLARLGFVATPYTLHRTTPTPGAEATPSGTANRCCMLDQGYLELLSVSDPTTPTGARTQGQIERYTGLHIIALAVEDPIGRSERLAARGFNPQEPVNLRRPVETAAGDEAMAAFTVCRTPAADMPEGRVQYLAHLTEDLVWQPRWMDHPNGITALRDVLIAVEDPAEAAARYARFLDREPEALAGGAVRFALDRGGIVLGPAPAIARLLRSETSAEIPTLPFIAGHGLLCRSLADTVLFLETAGFAPRRIGDGLAALTLPPALGGTWLLAESEAAFPWT